MIHISDTAKKIKKFLEEKGEIQFRIFIRLNFNIEVYVVSNDVDKAMKYQQEFIDLLSNNSSVLEDDEFDDFYKNHYDDLRIVFKVLSVEDLENDTFYQNMFSNNSDNIDLGPRFRFDSMLSKKSKVINARSSSTKAPVVTFYSYKGGMGRTTTMVAYAMSLAVNEDVDKRKRVVIIDCDLEAPGYLNFFDLTEHKGLLSGKKNGLVEFICDAQMLSNPEDLDINDYVINVGNDNENSFAFNNLDNIWIVPAGNLNEGYADLLGGNDRNDYLEGLAKINLSSVQSVINYFNLLFDKINEIYQPDIILIDSRTGFNDIFGTAALYLSNCVVGFFGFSRQTQPGLINLLKDYYKSENNFKLQLVFSILPGNVHELWINQHQQQVTDYINFIGAESKDYPSLSLLHRNDILEKIGTGDIQSDKAFVDIVQNKQFNDYNILFERINNSVFKSDEVSLFDRNVPAIQLRNAVLRHLKGALKNVSNFAEDTQMNESQFFYRECMKELFDPKKFLIQGYKGTGKTYLYKALANKEIASNIQKWAGYDSDGMNETIFINVLPTFDTETVFDNILYSKIEEPEYFFNCFWQIYTWNALLLYPDFESIRNRSALKNYVKPLEGTEYAKNAFVRINDLISDGVNTLIAIEKDMVSISNYLVENQRKLFVLYDRLDTCINPLRWNKAVSPLINYWRNNCESYVNITPKVFVRTDLFRQIEGTNTARLENSIIHIEWSIGEVFGFFFKLIFSDKKAGDAYWAIAEKVGIDANYINNTKKSFGKFPNNQFKSLRLAEMTPIIRVFFGNYVKVSKNEDMNLGTPWEYFEKELSNADNTAISLRPFINTMDSNAVDKALARTERFIHEIISSEIYASKSVREETTEKYFNDLTQDTFSKDLLRFKEVIRSSIGEPYRYKALTEVQFDKLIEITFERIFDSAVVKAPDDLKRLIFANGIMAEKITTKGKFYRFAPIYWYSWGLANSMLEKEERKRVNQTTKYVSNYDTPKQSFVSGSSYKGTIVEDRYDNLKRMIRSDIKPYPLPIKYCDCSKFRIGDKVFFVAKKESTITDSSKVFWYATDVQLDNG